MIAALLVLALQSPAPALDRVVLKDGSVRAGRVVSEDAGGLVLETLLLGAKGQVVGKAQVTILRSDVDRVERAGDAARRAAEDRARAFGERSLRRTEALARVKLVPERFEGRDGHRVDGAAFTLHSSAGAALTKDVAVALDEIFAAYRRFFQPRRDLDRKVRVLLFADKTEYDLHGMGKGGVVLAPAYYRVPDHTIVAYNLVERERERQIRAEIQDAQRDLERHRQAMQALERRVVDLVAAARAQIQEQAAELRRQVPPERRAEVDREERRLLEELKEGKGEAQVVLREERRKAQSAIEACQRVVDRNERIVGGQNAEMFETIYHEGFHAFAAAHLWQRSGDLEFPRWLHEGMACYFERSVVEGGSLVHGGSHPGMLRVMKQHYLSRTDLPLDKILRGGPVQFSLSHPAEADRQTAFYAHSWALAHYLSTRVTPKQIEAYVDAVLGGTEPAAAFEKLAGKPLPQVEAELKAHVGALP